MASSFSEQELREELVRVWKHLDRRPTYSEFRNRGEIGTKVYERRYGSWSQAVSELSKQAGVSIQGMKWASTNREQLLLELSEIAKRKPTGPLQYNDYKKLGGTFSIGAFQNHFKRWRDAVAAIGRKDGYSRPRPGLRRYTDNELSDEMERLYRLLGRPPKGLEMEKLGEIGERTYRERFGGRWQLVVAAFLKQRTKNNPDTLLPEEVPSTATFREGNVEMVQVNRHERDPRARKACIK